MTTAELQSMSRREPRTRLRLPVRGFAEFALMVWVYVVYSGLRNLVTGSPGAAVRHAIDIIQLDRAAHIDFGRHVRAVTKEFQWVGEFSKLVYDTHTIVPIIALVVLYCTCPARYRRWRNTFLFVLGIGLLGFWLYPTMPPHIVADTYHFVDNSHRTHVGHVLPGATAPDPDPMDVFGFSNPYAAVPSLHVAWAVLTSLAMWPLARRAWSKWCLAAYPVLMTLAVLATWNHWFLDAAAGCATVAVAYGLACLVERVTFSASALKIRGRAREILPRADRDLLAGTASDEVDVARVSA